LLRVRALNDEMMNLVEHIYQLMMLVVDPRDAGIKRGIPIEVDHCFAFRLDSASLKVLPNAPVPVLTKLKSPSRPRGASSARLEGTAGHHDDGDGKQRRQISDGRNQ